MEASHQAIACDLSKPRDLKMVHVPRPGGQAASRGQGARGPVSSARSGLLSSGWHCFHHPLSPARTWCDKSVEFGPGQSGFHILALQPLAKRLM